MLYFLQHILVHVGDLNRYSNQIDLAKIFYHYAIETIPCLGQPYNQIAILHEMKNPTSCLSPSHHQLIAMYYYIRSIAIKVTFPSAIANLEKLFQRVKENSLNRDEDKLNENEFYTLFLQLTSWIHLEINFDTIESLIHRFRSSIISNYNLTSFNQILTILMFTIHRTIGLLPYPSSTKASERSFDLSLQLLISILEQCLEAIQLPLSKMIVDEQQILPIVYLTFAYLAHLQKSQVNLFDHSVFQQKVIMWNSLAKFLRSFGVSAKTFEMSKSSFFIEYADYPLIEERTLECFTPLNDLFKGYIFKKCSDGLSEKDERQLRKFRLVSIVRNLCQRVHDNSSKKIFDHLLTYIKDDLIYFEASIPPNIEQIPSSNFGAPGDRRNRTVNFFFSLRLLFN